MFELGRDLRKLFAQARDSEDLSWLELISVDLLAVEARQQSTDAGRVSCAKPCQAALRSSALWREHARRTGEAESIERALKGAADAACAATSDDLASRAAIAVAQARLLRFDLTGGLDLLDKAARGADAISLPRRGETSLALAIVRARIGARQARVTQDNDRLIAALSEMDAVLTRIGKHEGVETDDLKLDRAGMALELGLHRRDPRLLDEAGQALRAIVEAASPDYRPVTRARALTLCAAGLSALSILARDDDAAVQAREMFEIAADQFTADHSPLDWVAVQIVRASNGDVALDVLQQAETLTANQGLVLGAHARDLRLSRQITQAQTEADLPALKRIEAEVRRSLSRRSGPVAPLDWAVDQIAMGRLSLARAAMTGERGKDIGFAVSEACAVAREHGILAIAGQAEVLVQRLTERV